MNRTLLFVSLLVLTGCIVVGHADDGAAVPQPVSSDASLTSVTGDGYPSIRLDKGGMTLSIYQPDRVHGYYTGVRFDPSGMVATATYHGHTIFGELKSPHRPDQHDHGVGTAEEFDLRGSDSFTAAATGEPFLKIGVGFLAKNDDKEYRFNAAYHPVSSPPWTITQGDCWIDYQHESGVMAGWGYSYHKRITINADGASFTILHALTNRGSKRMVTTQYCHNMVIIDHEPIGPAYSLRFPFVPKPHPDIPANSPAHIAGRVLSFSGPITGGSFWSEICGFSGKSADNLVEMRQTHAQVSLTISGDQPIHSCEVYAEPTGLCPEMFLRIALDPGETRTWLTRYACADLPQ